YGGALADFDAAMERMTARWAFIGRAAVHLLEGRRDEGLAQIELCRRSFESVPSATTHIYLGESERRAGNYAEAIEHLAESVRARPSRLSGWITLCLAHTANDDEAQ